MKSTRTYPWIVCIVLLAICTATFSKSINHKNFTFLKNQLSFAFYDHDFVTFDTPRPPSPIFWHATNQALAGGYFMYRRMVYHTQKYFSVYLGTDVAMWKSNSQNLYTLSGFVEIRWWVFHLNGFNPYFSYSIAGPSFISTTHFNNSNLGGNFIFQDFLGVGVQLGTKMAANFALYLWHYSNGDIFTHNPGFDIPIVYEFSVSF